MISFKTENEREEWAKLPEKNPKLMDLLIDVGDFTMAMYNKPIVITSLYRDPAEQAALYAKAEKKVVNSPHSFWLAADLRSSTFSKEEIDRICEYVNGRYKNANGKTVAFCHTVPGQAPHFHIQLYRG